jgi:2-keto-4-pentenoate hydratase/2-oxohepta-3-ene-1,7-dioic acid hydratase in catechol pathway
VRLATFRHDGRRRIGLVEGEQLVDLAAAAPALPTEMIALLEAGPEALAAARHARDAARSRLPLDAVVLEAPVPRPPKFLAIGLNYAAHAAESRGAGFERPAAPIFFNKQSTCVIGPGAAIHVPRASSQVDYEGELAFVIGRRGRHVPRGRAREVVAGFTVANDVSVRDWQRASPTMTLGKSFDTHGPLGPWLVTLDELDDPHALRLRTWVNGELRQDASTAEMLLDCWDQVAHLSTVFTLEVGDVVSTGTPRGVGMARTPPQWLRAGDRVRVEVERIGALENPVVDEPEGTAFVAATGDGGAPRARRRIPWS